MFLLLKYIPLLIKTIKVISLMKFIHKISGFIPGLRKPMVIFVTIIILGLGGTIFAMYHTSKFELSRMQDAQVELERKYSEKEVELSHANRDVGELVEAQKASMKELYRLREESKAVREAVRNFKDKESKATSTVLDSHRNSEGLADGNVSPLLGSFLNSLDGER